MRITMNRLALVFLTLFSFTAFPSGNPKNQFPQELVIDGKTFQISELKKILKTHEVTILEPHERYSKKTFLGFSFNEVLNYAYGNQQWQNNEQAVFTCHDGYKPTLPVKRFKEHKAYLAFAIKGSDKFEIHNIEQNEKVNVGPLYLVWENINDKSAQTHGASIWPYQIHKISFAKFQEIYGKITPPTNSSANVINGFHVFASQCSSCHSFYGVGGEKQSDITESLKALDDKTLKAFLDNPRTLFPQGNMPALSKETPNREKAISDMVTFFRNTLKINK
jgi:cytochrome c2